MVINQEESKKRGSNFQWVLTRVNRKRLGEGAGNPLQSTSFKQCNNEA
jgi:hypothetical protein